MRNEGIEDLYNIKRPNRELYVILIVAVVAILIFWLFITAEKPMQKKAFVEKCENMLIESKNNYIICCVEGENIVDCTDKKTFRYDDFLIVQANLLSLNKYFPTYHACAFYTLLETSVESQKNITLEEIQVGVEKAVCSKRLGSDYNNLENFGYIKNRDEITLFRIYIFPPIGLNTTQDFVDDIDRGMLVLNLTANVA